MHAELGAVVTGQKSDQVVCSVLFFLWCWFMQRDRKNLSSPATWDFDQAGKFLTFKKIQNLRNLLPGIAKSRSDLVFNSSIFFSKGLIIKYYYLQICIIYPPLMQWCSWQVVLKMKCRHWSVCWYNSLLCSLYNAQKKQQITERGTNSNHVQSGRITWSSFIQRDSEGSINRVFQH